MRSWSVSSIKGFHACQLQWWFKRRGEREEFRPLPLVEGITLHAALAFHLKAAQAGKTPDEPEVLELLDAVLFDQEMQGTVKWGQKTREEILDRLGGLYRLWRERFKPEGDILAVEQEVRAHLPGIDLPLLGYADLVLKSDKGLTVIDFKTSSSKPYGNSLFDPIDLQKLAMTRGLESATGEPVVKWAWQHLVKTKVPQFVDDPWEIRAEDRDGDLAKLRSIVNPTIAAMRLVEEGKLAPVPTQSFFSPCGNCPYSVSCSRWTGGPPPAANIQRGAEVSNVGQPAAEV